MKQNYNNNQNYNNRNFQQNHNKKHYSGVINKIVALVFFLLLAWAVYDVAGLIQPTLVSRKADILSCEKKYEAACRMNEVFYNCKEEKMATREQQFKDKKLLVRSDIKQELFFLIIMLITLFAFIRINRKK